MDASTAPAPALVYASPLPPAAPAPGVHYHYYYQPACTPPPQQQPQQQRTSITDMPRRVTPLMLLNPVHLTHIAIATAALPFKKRRNQPATGDGSTYTDGPEGPMLAQGRYTLNPGAWQPPASVPLQCAAPVKAA